MISVKLYKNFTKKLNSTLTPLANQSSDTYDCYFLDAQSVMHPVLILEDTRLVGSQMAEYTYAYIADLKRYYFISNAVIIDNNRWAIYLQVDVLASYLDDILNSTQYVIRSTNRYNNYITDTMYPTVPLSQAQRFALSTKVGNTIYALDNKTGVWSSIDFFNQNYTSGSVIFGVTGQGNVSVDYYVATVTEFKAFINRVVTATPTGLNWGNLPQGVQTTLSNLMQYITFAKWIPFMPLTGNLGGAVTSIYLGTTGIEVTAYKVVAGLSNQLCRFSLSIPNHPLYSTHNYYNLTPYREVNLFFLPLGIIPIDTTKIWDVSTLYINFMVDLASGNTEFTIVTNEDEIFSGDHILMSTVTNIGIDLSLTDYSLSMEAALYSAASSFISNAIKQIKPTGGSSVHTSSAGIVHGGQGGTFNVKNPRASKTPSSVTVGGRDIDPSSYTTFTDAVKTNLTDGVSDVAKDLGLAIGNALQPLGDVLGTASDFIASSFGQVSMNGHTGSFLMYMATMPSVFCWFYKHGTEDYNRFGRPFYDIVALSQVRGFCLCKDAYVDYGYAHPLKPEIEGINNLLNTGIYIEETK